jgi:hypothetical protein
MDLSENRLVYTHKQRISEVSNTCLPNLTTECWIALIGLHGPQDIPINTLFFQLLKFALLISYLPFYMIVLIPISSSYANGLFYFPS